MTASRTTLSVRLDELPHELSDWRDLIREFFYRRDDDVELIDRMVLDRGRPYLHFTVTSGLPEEANAVVADEIKRDCEELLRRDRRSWTGRAWAALEQRERLQASLRDTSTALATIEKAKEALVTSGKVAEAASKIAQAVATIMRTWEWLA
ncbi:MAG: hypothetical protein ABIO70_26000 [Pseudomonadota bacterium]